MSARVDLEAGSIPITPDQVLALAGRLDDAPGFDTARERFRRFLAERVDEVQFAKTLIGHWQRSGGEQHHRALQDGLVILGKFLGFETSFGTYQRVAGVVKYSGHWRSRRRLHVVLELRTDQTPRADFESLTRALGMLTTSAQLEAEARRLGLCIVTPAHGARGRLDDLLAVEKPNYELRVASVHSLVFLAEKAAAGILGHDHVVKLLTTTSNLNLVVELLERLDTEKPIDSDSETPAAIQTEPRYWMATIIEDGSTSPEQLVQSLVGRRRVLGFREAESFQRPPQPDDWVCFLLPDTGVAGHGQVEALADPSADLIRDSDRVDRILRLKNVELYNTPILSGRASARQVRAALSADGSGPVLAQISRVEFEELTKVRPPAGLQT